MNAKKKYLITAALPYVNNIPHLGNIIGSLLSADVFARYCRLAGHETLFICGTDEYGTATEMKAFQEKTDPQTICDRYHAIHKEIYNWFQIAYDVFGRTSTPIHTTFTQALFHACEANGFIGTQTSEQYFDEAIQRFLADRYLIGTCPYCHNPQSHADQCDQCGKLLSAEELTHIKSAISNTIPSKKTATHLTLKLPALEGRLKEWLTHSSTHWSLSANAITQSWMKEGLKERTITRDLEWGVAVPKKGFEKKVFYVWFDAPIGYISITASARADWKKWWQSTDVLLYQFMGKDNVPFHSILFPSMLMASGQNWQLPTKICSTEYLNYESEKFSKSRNQGVFGQDAMQSGIPSDYWRFYLLAIRPENNDTHFLWSELKAKINNELVANLGNLVHRTLVFIQSKMKGYTPKAHTYSQIDQAFIDQSHAIIDEIKNAFEAAALKECLQKIMHYARSSNKYLQDTAPWKSIKTDPITAQTTMALLLITLSNLAIVISPYLPQSATALFSQLGIAPRNFSELHHPLPEGVLLPQPTPLFTLLEDAQIDILIEKLHNKTTPYMNP